MISDPEKKLRYELAALADLDSQSTQLDPQAFSQAHLDPEDRDTFVSLFRADDGSVPLTTKDTGLIKARIATAFVEFTNGLRLSGPRLAMEDAVTIDGDQTTIASSVRHIGRRG